MFEYLASLPFWDYVLIVLNCAGILTWSWIVVCLLIPLRRKDFAVPLTRNLLRLYRVLMNRIAFIVLLIGGVSSFVSALYMGACNVLIPIFDLGPLELPAFNLIVFSTVLGLAILFVLGGKGWSLPVGRGLMVSIERAPVLANIDLSAYVLCFHVTADFFEKPQAGKNLLVNALRQGRHVSDQYDIVLKSWMFSERDEGRERRVGKVRILMARIRTVFIMGVVQMPLLLVALWNSTLSLWKAFLMGSMVIIVPLVWLMTRYLRSASRLTLKISAKAGSSIDEAPSVVIGLLQREIAMRVKGYRHSFIATRPISRTHLVGMSWRSSRVMKTCAGTEAGLVLKPLTGPVQPDQDRKKALVKAQAPKAIEMSAA